MKIRQKNTQPPGIKHRIIALVNRRRYLIALFSFGSIALLAILFFSVLAYGAHLKEVGVMTYFKNSAVKAASLDLSFVENYAKGHMQELDEMHIDIKFKHLLRIRYLREKSLENGLISSAAKDEEFPARITFKNKTYNVKISLTGLIAQSHLKDPERWSFQVKVRGDNTIHGMKRFGVLRPSTRGFMTDWLAFELMKNMGLIGLRVDYVQVSMNGKETGIYYLEERFDKYLIENNQLREGIIFKLDGQLSPYQESKIHLDPVRRDQLLMLKRMWQSVSDGDLEPSHFFDLKKMAKLFVVCDLMNNKHPLALQNLRFYYNPISGLVEPIAREWEKLERTELETLRLFFEKPVDGDRHLRLQNNPILRMIYDNHEFIAHYVRHAEIMSQKTHLDELIKNIRPAMEPVISKVHRLWPFYEIPLNKLYQHQSYMRSVIFPVADQLEAKIEGLRRNSLCLNFHNLQSIPIKIEYLSVGDSIRIIPSQSTIVESNSQTNQTVDFELPSSMDWTTRTLDDLKIFYRFIGSQSDAKSIVVTGDVVKTEEVVTSLDLERENFNLASASLMIIDEEQKKVTIPSGKHQISQSLIIPSGYQVEVKPDTDLDFINNAGLTSYSPIFCQGEEGRSIRFRSSDSSDIKISIIRAPELSTFNYVDFQQIGKSLSHLSGGILNIIDAPIDIVNCTFSKSNHGNCLLYINSSHFLLDHSSFNGMNGTAFISEHSEGTIRNCSFTNVQTSAFRAVDSRVALEFVYMNNIGGHGIEASNNSYLPIHVLDIRNAQIGISAHGWSKLALSDIQLKKNIIGLSSGEDSKRGPADIIAFRIEMHEVSTHHRIDEQSSLIIDGKQILTEEPLIKVTDPID